VYRLDHSTLQNGSGTSTNLALTYDAMGNITSRSDIAAGAAWSYHATKKHAVTQAGSASLAYGYDANGNATVRHGNTITWSSYNYPTVINGANKSLTFSYGPNRERYRQVYVSGSVTETTVYVGGLLEKVTVAGGTTDWRHYVKVGSQTIAIVSRLNTGANTTRYVLEDHQGSPSRLTEINGASYVQESFTAFGARRDPGTWTDSCLCDDLTKIKDVSRRGYTGHEAIGGVSMGLNHMNGRVQDAITGRFLSADPVWPGLGSTQGFNRYSYVNNNPLSFIDPSGFVCQGSISDGPGMAEAALTCNGPGHISGWRGFATYGGSGIDGSINNLYGGATDASQWLKAADAEVARGLAELAAHAPALNLPEDRVDGQKNPSMPQSRRDSVFDKALNRFGYSRSTSECGAKGGLAYPSSFGDVNFNGACQTHDACYGVGSPLSRQTCDENFRRDTIYAFADIHSSWSPVDGYYLYKGMEMANTYFTAVQLFGEKHYEGQASPKIDWARFLLNP
jgi:RHS repeat-associated protein